MTSETREPLQAQPAAANGGGDGGDAASPDARKRGPPKPVDPMIALAKEIDIMKALRHPNIVSLHEVRSVLCKVSVYLSI